MINLETFSSSLPARVRIVEVGPRDGLQNEAATVSVADRINLIERLAKCGLTTIEAGSFVSPNWIPQMAESETVFAGLQREPGVSYTALTPNLKGFKRALSAGVDEIAVFSAASETFSQRNTNCSIAQSLTRFEEVFIAAQQHNIPVRGYVSCVLACPYEGDVAPEKVASLTQTLLQMGCYEVSLGDTIGVGSPLKVARLLDKCLQQALPQQLAVHFHNTYGQALANILTALQMGISTLDSSVAGLGGCPYAVGASGNAATEDVVYQLQGMGIETGIDLQELIAVSHWISNTLGHPPRSQLALATQPRTDRDEQQP
ncbi:MAG: hydroxymethylglutaryl-CoA lyase [Pseudomonadales bacterium]|nr:hydroxymethylglutaryl-CoA lyase [Pseudomonadales bacterium]